MPIINSIIKGGGGSAPTLYREYQINANGVLVSNTTTTHVMNFTGVKELTDYMLNNYCKGNTNITSFINMSDVISIGNYACESAFYGAQNVQGVDLSSLTTITAYGCRNMFYGAYRCKTADLRSLKTITANNAIMQMFYNCLDLESFNLSSLEAISGNNSANSLFANTKITTADLSSLTAIASSSSFSGVFLNCNRLSVVYLSSLRDITGNLCCASLFSACNALKLLSFPALKNFGTNTSQFTNMLQGCTDVIVHFPSNLQSVIGSWTTVTGGFGGTNTTVLFDLPATVILTGADTVSYERNPKYDTATALAWRIDGTSVLTATPYYTSGTTDPQVNDTIYSDDACTVAVTTISAIA